MAGEGRPTSCTPEATARMAEALSKGRSVRASCRYAGISADSHYSWLKRAESGEGPPFSDYRDATRKAEAAGEDRHLRVIEGAAEEDWRASAWLLERTRPADYGRQHVEITGASGGPIQIEDIRSQVRAELATTGSADLGIPADVLPDGAA